MEKTKQKKTKSDQQQSLESPERRKAVKGLVAGVGAIAAYSAFPTNWSKPIIEQIFLPAHAGTSGIFLDPCIVDLNSGDATTPSVNVRVRGYADPPPPAGTPVEIVATATGGAGSTETVNTTTAADGTFSGVLVLGGGPGIIVVNAVTTVTGASNKGSCSINIPVGEVETTPPPMDTSLS